MGVEGNKKIQISFGNDRKIASNTFKDTKSDEFKHTSARKYNLAQSIFKRYDLNRDGVLDERELNVIQEQMFRYSNDGTLGKREARTFIEKELGMGGLYYEREDLYDVMFDMTKIGKTEDLSAKGKSDAEVKKEPKNETGNEKEFIIKGRVPEVEFYDIIPENLNDEDQKAAEDLVNPDGNKSQRGNKGTGAVGNGHQVAGKPPVKGKATKEKLYDVPQNEGSNNASGNKAGSVKTQKNHQTSGRQSVARKGDNPKTNNQPAKTATKANAASTTATTSKNRNSAPVQQPNSNSKPQAKTKFTYPSLTGLKNGTNYKWINYNKSNEKSNEIKVGMSVKDLTDIVGYPAYWEPNQVIELYKKANPNAIRDGKVVDLNKLDIIVEKNVQPQPASAKQKSAKPSQKSNAAGSQPVRKPQSSRPMKSEKIKIDNKSYTRETYYNSKNQPEKSVYKNASNRIDFTYKYEYNANNKRVKTIVLDANNNLSTVYNLNPNTGKIIYKASYKNGLISHAENLDSQGRVIKKTDFKNGKFDFTTNYKYDSYGQLCEKTLYRHKNGAKSGTLEYKEVYTYNAKGQLTSINNFDNKEHLSGRAWYIYKKNSYVMKSVAYDSVSQPYNFEASEFSLNDKKLSTRTFNSMADLNRYRGTS